MISSSADGRDNGSSSASINTLCPPTPKKHDYILYNNFNSKCPITIIFGIVSSQSMRHRKMV